MNNILPTDFELCLTRRDKEGLVRVVEWLLERGCMDFQWEFKMLETTEVYELCIQSSWADNLAQIARLLSDYTDEAEEAADARD